MKKISVELDFDELLEKILEGLEDWEKDDLLEGLARECGKKVIKPITGFDTLEDEQKLEELLKFGERLSLAELRDINYRQEQNENT